LTEAIGKLGGQVKMSPLDEGEEKDRLIPGEYQDYNLEENAKALAELDQVDAYLAEMEQQMELRHEEEDWQVKTCQIKRGSRRGSTRGN